MALLPKIPWTDIDGTRVAVDAPISTDLWTDTVIDLNYLKATLTDGALAPQGIVTSSFTGTGVFLFTGPWTFVGNGVVTGDLAISGTLSVGVFFSSEQLLFLTAL